MLALRGFWAVTGAAGADGGGSAAGAIADCSACGESSTARSVTLRLRGKTPLTMQDLTACQPALQALVHPTGSSGLLLTVTEAVDGAVARAYYLTKYSQRTDWTLSPVR